MGWRRVAHETTQFCPDSQMPVCSMVHRLYGSFLGPCSRSAETGAGLEVTEWGRTRVRAFPVSAAIFKQTPWTKTCRVTIPRHALFPPALLGNLQIVVGNLKWFLSNVSGPPPRCMYFSLVQPVSDATLPAWPCSLLRDLTKV